MKPVKWLVSLFLILIGFFILCIIIPKAAKPRISPEITVNSTSISSTGDQIMINYTLKNDFYSNPAAGHYLYIGFEYPESYRRAFENQYAEINQKAGTYSVALPYTKGLEGNIYIMTHYQAAWGRGIDEYINKGLCFVSSNS
jgi:hypothetical protein